MWRIAWCLESGRPKAVRSRANSAVRSHASCIAPTAPSAIARRSHWKLAMISLKPSCSAPSRFSVGHEHVLEGDRRGVGGVPAELLELGGGDALAAVDDQERDAVVAALGSVVLTAVTMKCARTPLVM